MVRQVIAPGATRQSDTIGPEELADYMGIAVGTVRQRRSKDPLALPVPFCTRPLRWRLEAVQRWMEQQEREEAERIRRLFVPSARSARAARI